MISEGDDDPTPQLTRMEECLKVYCWIGFYCIWIWLVFFTYCQARGDCTIPTCHPAWQSTITVTIRNHFLTARCLKDLELLEHLWIYIYITSRVLPRAPHTLFRPRSPFRPRYDPLPRHRCHDERRWRLVSLALQPTSHEAFGDF